MEIKITESDLSFECLKTKRYYPIKFDDEITKANILLMPLENFRKGIDVAFPEITDEFFKFLKKNETEFIIPSIVIDDEEYRKIELHSSWLFLGRLLVEFVALPLLIDLISNFIYDRISKNKLTNDSDVKVEINVEETKTKKTKRITYEGSAKDFNETLSKIADKVFDEKQ